MQLTQLAHRPALRVGAIIAIAAILSSGAPAHALHAAAPAAVAGAPQIEDLGPAVVQFSLMSSVTIGDTVYVGSRNVEPARIVRSTTRQYAKTPRKTPSTT